MAVTMIAERRGKLCANGGTRGRNLRRPRRWTATRRTWRAARAAIRPEWFYTETIREELHQCACINWCTRAVCRGKSRRDRAAWRWTRTWWWFPAKPPRDLPPRAISRHSPAPRWLLSGSSTRTRRPLSRRRHPCRPSAPRRRRRHSPGPVRSLPSCSSRCRPSREKHRLACDALTRLRAEYGPRHR